MASSTTTTTTVSTTTTTTVQQQAVITGYRSVGQDPTLDPESTYIAAGRVLARTEMERVIGPQYPKSTWESGDNVVEYITHEEGVVTHSYGDENLFFRLWFEPNEIDAGFIVEDAEYTIKIWNAWFEQVANVTAVNIVGSDGISVDHTATPFVIPKFGDTTATVTVYRVGPPLQDSAITFTVDAVDYVTEVSGLRVVAWTPEPDWEVKVDIELIFETVLVRNRFFEEQRRPLRVTPYKRLKCTAWAKGLDNEKVKQTLAYGHDKVFGVPIYSEPCYPSASFNGVSVINLSNTTDNLWHLNNLAAYVIIVDHYALQAEIKEIDTIASSSITLVRDVSETFDHNVAVVYPMFFATLDSVGLPAETDDLQHHDVQFTEYVSSD